MKKNILVVSLLFSFLGFSQEKKENIKPPKKTCKEKVYICNSASSTTYHLNNQCGALNRCKDTIVSICKDKAKKQFGRLLCSLEKN